MSIVASCDEGWIVSHEEYVAKAYKRKYRLRSSLFNINKPYKIQKKKKSKIDPLAQTIQDKLAKLLTNIDDSVAQLNPLKIKYYNGPNNFEAMKMAEKCSKQTLPLKSMNNTNGGNLSSEVLCREVNNHRILFPEMCRFLCGDIKLTLDKVTDKDFNLIVIDPPWWNKSMRQKRMKKNYISYTMMYTKEITNLPVSKFLAPGAMVAIWCTNCTAHETAIKEDMFTLWGVTHVATWFWVKLTKSGEPVCPFASTNNKQPYERLILGYKDKSPDQVVPPDWKIFASVPSALHSHKPPLNDLLAPYIPSKNIKCLELFARYLLPGTTSVGLEPLRWQDISLYTSNFNNISDDESKNENEANVSEH